MVARQLGMVLNVLEKQSAALVREQSVSIVAADGYRLAATRFEPARAHRSLVVINGAIGVPHRFYARFARYLANAGFDVLTYDYRGIAASRVGSLRSLATTIVDWGARDFEAVLRYAIDSLGYRRVDLVGHSVGGQLLGFAGSADVVRRVVGVASQLADYRYWPAPRRWYIATMMGVVVPTITRIVGYLPGRLAGEPLPAGVALEWARWCMTPGYFVSELSDAERGRFAQRRDVMAYSIERDPIASAEAVSAWTALFRGIPVRRRHIADPAVGHFGFFKAGPTQAYWDEVRDFLSA